jgi:hypothetical protein
MITFRSQEFESLGFEWDSHSAAWEVRLSELTNHRKIHWECTNVSQHHSENPKLGQWVRTQRSNYRLQLEGKRLQMTGPRIQALGSLGFEWGPSIGRGKETRKNPSLDDDARRVHKTSPNSGRGANSQLVTAPPNEILRTTDYH